MKHLELIKAAIDGKIIEWRHSPPVMDWWRVLGDLSPPEQRLRTCICTLAAEYPSQEYRIQPKPDRVIYRVMVEDKEGASGEYVDYSSRHGLSGDGQFKLTYDGETGRLKSVEIVE